jgi:signal recognition particle GTPase
LDVGGTGLAEVGTGEDEEAPEDEHGGGDNAAVAGKSKKGKGKSKAKPARKTKTNKKETPKKASSSSTTSSGSSSSSSKAKKPAKAVAAREKAKAAAAKAKATKEILKEVRSQLKEADAGILMRDGAIAKLKRKMRNFRTTNKEDPLTKDWQIAMDIMRFEHLAHQLAFAAHEFQFENVLG